MSGITYFEVWDATVLVCVPIVARDVKGMTGTEIDDEGSWCKWQLVWVLMVFIWVKCPVAACKTLSRGFV